MKIRLKAYYMQEVNYNKLHQYISYKEQGICLNPKYKNIRKCLAKGLKSWKNGLSNHWHDTSPRKYMSSYVFMKITSTFKDSTLLHNTQECCISNGM